MEHLNCNCIGCIIDEDILKPEQMRLMNYSQYLTETQDKDKVYFYITTKPYGFMSNFYKVEQIVDGITYPTNEHYYQSMKAKDPAIREWIARSPKAWHSMKAGRNLKPKEMIDNWDELKIVFMLKGLRAKFNQNEILKQKLLETGDAIIIENSPKDAIWGGKLVDSSNLLGILLMQVRKELKFEESEKIVEVRRDSYLVKGCLNLTLKSFMPCTSCGYYDEDKCEHPNPEGELDMYDIRKGRWEIMKFEIPHEEILVDVIGSED